MKTIAITGYKPHELGVFTKSHPAVFYIKKLIEKELKVLLDEGLEWVIISGQLGVELWAAEVVIELRLDYPQLNLAVLTPFLNQEERWKDSNKEQYERVLMEADFVDSITKRPYENPKQFMMKNQFVIKKTDGLLLIYDEEKPGSPQFMLETARKMKSQNEYTIRAFSFYDLQNIVEELQEDE
ncbi:DUF1273 domain-containing protein [Bacillus sp. FJAT-42376]|uniref:DUF1273 domain-containing protein n=1 Tax=Bacillus sp. FJAT-42376 TaxID=2014076 RepID=UPI000F4F0699|nr:DUF1273 domain-containing protein [Bacillus sp. FJAT-42376]AZB44873.1 DUF1273 domain-containing protein [Bacillus sp. FJAT-42376]